MSLSIVSGKLKSALAQYGVEETLQGYLASPAFPSPLTENSTMLINNFLSELNTVKFPGGRHRIPRDCLFCRKGAVSPPSVTCFVCEEDRDEIMRFYQHLKSYNTLMRVPALRPETDPDAISVCDIWSGIIRCNSPWSYVIDLEGLGIPRLGLG